MKKLIRCSLEHKLPRKKKKQIKNAICNNKKGDKIKFVVFDWSDAKKRVEKIIGKKIPKLNRFNCKLKPVSEYPSVLQFYYKKYTHLLHAKQ